MRPRPIHWGAAECRRPVVAAAAKSNKRVAEGSFYGGDAVVIGLVFYLNVKVFTSLILEHYLYYYSIFSNYPIQKIILQSQNNT